MTTTSLICPDCDGAGALDDYLPTRTGHRAEDYETRRCECSACLGTGHMLCRCGDSARVVLSLASACDGALYVDRDDRGLALCWSCVVERAMIGLATLPRSERPTLETPVCTMRELVYGGEQ